MYSIYRKKGFTLLESVIALGLAMIALAAIMLSYNNDKRNAEQVIAQLSALTSSPPFSRDARDHGP